MHLSSRKTSNLFHVEFRILSVQTFPVLKMSLGQFLDSQNFFLGKLQAIGFILFSQNGGNHQFLKVLRGNLLLQMVGHVTNSLPHRLDTFGNNLVLIHPGGIHHLLDIRGKKQRSVVDNAFPQMILGIAGKLSSLNTEVISSVKFCFHGKLCQGIQYRA